MFTRNKSINLDSKLKSTEDIIDIVERMSYKPGSEITAEEAYGGEVKVTLFMAPTRDAYNPDREFRLQADVWVDSKMFKTGRELVDFLRVALFHNMETHEADEWVRVGGDMLYDPHTEGRITESEWVRVQ